MHGAPAARVLDSWILVGWLKGQTPAAEAMERLWEEAEQGRVRLGMNVVNLGEIYYLTAKTRDLSAADFVLGELLASPLALHPASNELVFRAAGLKARFAISYADAFAAATAMEFTAPLTTGDAEFRPLESAGLIDLDWVG